MARIETWFDQDLKKPVQVHKLEGIFNEDSQGNVIGVNLFDDGVALTSIAGSVTGYFLLADGTTTSAAGTKSGNKASVVIPPAAYKVPGPITITVRILNSSDITTVCACVGLVILSKTPVATPAGSTVADWSAQISAALQNCEDVVAQSVKYGSAQSLTDAQKAQARTNIGAASQTDMSTAQTVIGNTALPTTAQTLTGAVAEHESDLTNQQGQITDLKSAIQQISDNVFSTEFVHLADNKMASGSIRGIDYSVIGNTVKINGTATGAVRLKVSGNSFVEGTSVEQSWLSESIGLVTGHKYVACAELVSGSLGTTRFVIYGSESTSAVYQLDFTSSNAQKGKVVYGSEFTASATNSSAFVIYMASGWTASNACIKFDLLDLTAAENFIFEKIGHDYHIPEQIIQMSRNALFPLGYKDIITKNGTMDYNGITAEVSGNKIKLNGTCTSAIRLKLTNDIEYAHSVDSNWYNETIGVPNNNHIFMLAVSRLAGTGTSEDMSVVFYNESGSKHGITLISSSKSFALGMKYSDEIEDLSDLNCLCIYIKTGVVLNNMELQIGLYDITELKQIRSFTDEVPIPAYYYDNNYLTNKIESIKNIGLGLSVNSIRFVFDTDYHMAKNANNSPNIIKKISKDTGIKTVIFNGDYMVSETTSIAGYNDLCDFISLVAPLNEVADVHFATGNHEWNDPSASYSDRRISRGALIQLLNAYDSQIRMLDPSVSNAFYVDFDIPKIRCYCIDMEYNATISMDTRTKMFETLLSVPECYAVLVCSHGAMKDATNTEMTGRFKQIMECCAAMNDGVSITLNDVTYDFTNKARTFIGALTGHTHVDGYLIYDDRFPVIVTECDAWNAQASGGTRINGTVEEQAFEVVQIDVIAKRIYLTRIGHGNDRVFSFGETGAGLVT